MPGTSNPYLPPESDAAARSPNDSPLYSVGQLAVGTVLGLPIAGCWMLAANFEALGRSDLRRATLACGAAATIVALAAVVALPQPFGHLVAHVGSASAIAFGGSALQAAARESQFPGGAPVHDWWRPFAIGVGFLVATYGLLIAFFLSIWFGLAPE